MNVNTELGFGLGFREYMWSQENIDSTDSIVTCITYANRS